MKTPRKKLSVFTGRGSTVSSLENARCVCVRVCVRACVRVCVRACVHQSLYLCSCDWVVKNTSSVLTEPVNERCIRADPSHSQLGIFWNKMKNAGKFVQAAGQKTKLKAEIALMDQNMKGRKQQFGIEMYDLMEQKKTFGGKGEIGDFTGEGPTQCGEYA